MSLRIDPVKAIAGARNAKLTKTGWIRDRPGKNGRLIRENVKNAAQPQRWRKDIYGVPKRGLYRQVFDDPGLTVKRGFRRHSHSAVGNLNNIGSVKKGFVDKPHAFPREKARRIPMGIMRKALRRELSNTQASKYFSRYIR